MDRRAVLKMLVILCVLVCGAVASNIEDDPVGNQLVIYKKEHPVPTTLTTSAGAPVELKEATVTLNSNLLTNEFFMESLTQFINQKIPERVVHAKGAGAFGYFEVTHDITDVCKSKLFSKIGKKTPVAVRFSIIIGQRGVSDLSKGTRGLAVKFYTEEGNFDIVGINFPVFIIKDPLLFTTFARSSFKNPTTYVHDANAMWDFITTNPETFFEYLFILGDTGIPDGYRYLASFSVHTYQVANQQGDLYFVRYHIIPNAGYKTLLPDDAKKIGGEDPDYATRDLYQAIEKGNYPSWNISVQVLSMDDVSNAGFDVFDTSKLLPVKKYPLRPIGRMVLNRNPINYFAEVEQLAFSPANYVNGMYGAPDKIFEARRFAYRHSQYHRLGENFNRIPVNCPFQTKAFTYNRNGVPPVGYNGGDSPAYFPNTFNGPAPYVDKQRIELIQIKQDQSDNFEQVKDWYLNEMTEDERSRLVENIVSSLSNAIKELQDRAVKLFTRIYPEFGDRVAEGLNSTQTERK